MLPARSSPRGGLVLASCLLALGCQARGSGTLPATTQLEVAAGPSSAAPPGSGAPAALLELFTSEGCSSCPAADENLAQITREAERTGQRIFTLELHVDYWNYLGWVDPFSDAVSSSRQGAYAQQLGLRGVYTPQLLVNGREELVGSDHAGSRAAIERALGTPARAALSIAAVRRDGAIELDYRLEAPRAVALNVAVAVDAAETHVSRGENADRQLFHRHVVRGFRSLGVAGHAKGRVSVPWPAGRSQPVFVVAFASDPTTLQVLGADAQLLAAANE